MQTATYLPYFLLALPAGALADVVDRRVQVLATGVFIFFAVLALGLLTVSGFMTAWLLLFMIFVVAVGQTLQSPAWNSLPPELVPRRELDSAIALGGAGFNCARGVGAALGGYLVFKLGAGWVFVLNAFCLTAMLIAVYRWKREPVPVEAPAERLGSAVKAGVRYVRHSLSMRAVLARTAIFVICGSCVWAILPLLARKIYSMSSTEYGIALSIFGAGTLAGAAIMPRLRQSLNLDWLCALGTLMYACAMVALASNTAYAAGCAALFTAGVGWLLVSAAVNSSILKAAPAWVRARAVAVYLLVFNGSLAFGSLVWGCIAQHTGMQSALVYGAGGLVVGLLFMLRYSLEAVEKLDMRTSGPRPAPAVLVEPHPDRGPVQVTVEYIVADDRAEQFLTAISRLETQRRRNGAFQWHLFVDLTRPGVYVESFLVETWGEHLRLRNRNTVDDLAVEQHVHTFHSGAEPPKISHLLAERRRAAPATE
jgi:predicted MFS family arabinose efflux permease